MGSSVPFALPPLPLLPALPALPGLPAGSSLPPIPGLATPIAGNSAVDAVLGQLNAQRIAAGLAPVSFDWGIADRSYNYARELSGNHTLNHSGTELEILARVPDIGMAVPMWFDSPPHHAVMMRDDISRVGIGIEWDAVDGRWVVVAQFQ